MLNRLREYSELIKLKSGKESAAEVSWIIFGQAINVILSFIILKFLSKLGTNDYGIYALIITLSSLFSSIFYGPAIQGFMRFYYDYLRKGAVSNYINLIFRFLYFSAIFLFITTILFFLFSYVIDFPVGPLLIFSAGIYILTARVSEFFNSFLNLLRKRKLNSLLQAFERSTTALLLLILLINKNLNLTVIFVLLSLSAALFALFKIYYFRKNVPEEINASNAPGTVLSKEIRKQIFVYTLPFIIWGITGWLQLNGEKWIIAGMLSTSTVGVYAVMMSLVTAFIVIPAAILSEFSTPIIFQKYSDSENPEQIKTGYTFIRLNMLLIFLAAFASAVITAVSGKEIITLISSSDYALYWYLLPMLCAGTGLFYMGQSLTSLGMALNKPGKYLAPKVLTGILSITLYYFLVRYFGVAGVAYTTIFTGMIYLVYIMAINRKLISEVLK